MVYNISEKTRKNFWLTLIIIVHLTFSYYYFKGWWNSAIGTALIILLSYFIWKKDFLKNIGLKSGKLTIPLSVALSIIIIILSSHLSDYIATKHNIEIMSTSYRYYFHSVFYTLNDEIILGALLLFYCIKSFKLHPLLISAAVAVIFSILHFIFYKWIFLDTGIIQPLTLTTLFVVGFLRNNLIITFGHIGYSWAFHFGWMTVMFGSYHFNTLSREILTGSQRFNLCLGSLEMLFIATILAGISVWIYLRKNKSI